MPPKGSQQKLREAKAFLRRLQTLEEYSSAHTEDTAPERKARYRFSYTSSLSYLAGLVLIAAGALALTGDELSGTAQASFAIITPGEPSYVARESSSDDSLGKALHLMDTGHIIEARRLLLRPDVAATQDGAWRLARSYDPNYLAGVALADATSDRAQAAEWYRRWRDIGAGNGMVMDDLHLKRIIDSMR
jgi:hypothetical protein